MRLVLETLSVGLHTAIFRDPTMSLCARAWLYQENWFWGRWVLIWDWVFLVY